MEIIIIKDKATVIDNIKIIIKLRKIEHLQSGRRSCDRHPSKQRVNGPKIDIHFKKILTLQSQNIYSLFTYK